jgi:hypothetical protein
VLFVGCVLDDMVADLVHQTIEEHEVPERVTGPLDQGAEPSCHDPGARAL